jgi:hypothetical protein
MTTEASAPAAPAAAPVTSAPAAPVTEVTTAAPAPVTEPQIGDPPAAPPAAPVAPEAVAKFNYNPTGDVGMDMALGFVGNLGYSPDHPAMKSAMDGDFGPIKAALKALGAKATGWENHVALAEKADKDHRTTESARIAKDTANVHEAVGGEERWKAISTWAGKEATPEEKADVNNALKQGGITARLMAQWLAEKYNKAGGTTKVPAEVVKDGAKGAPAATGALSASAYAMEVQALRGKMGYKMDGSPQYAALQARRIAGKKAGV